MAVLLKNVKIANADNAVSGIAQTERSLCDTVGDRNRTYKVNNIYTLRFDGKDNYNNKNKKCVK